jgi:hypothetical protein
MLRKPDKQVAISIVKRNGGPWFVLFPFKKYNRLHRGYEPDTNIL